MGVTIRRALVAAFCVLANVAGAHAATYAKGLDVSNWQGSIDWLQVAGDGYTFAFAKATEGTTFTDVTYAVNRAGTQGLGLRLGAYHFARPAGSGDPAIVASAIAQADRFVDVAQPRAGDLPPVLDLEATGNLAPAALTRWTQVWLDEVTARTGIKGLVYTSPSFWKTRLGDASSPATSGTRLWIAHWTKGAAPLVPASNWGGSGWTFWQWTSCQTIPGIAHCVDADRANAADPSPFVLHAYPSGAPAPSTPPAVVGTARAGARLAGLPGTWAGGKPVAFAYQWQSCDAAGAGCTPIPGAALETYVPTATDVGHAIVLSVTATTKAGAAAAVSPPTLAVAAANGATRPAVLAPPQVTGTAQVGQTLTAGTGTWSGAPTGFAYQWQRCDATGAACVAIAGATATTYVTTPGDLGATISLVVTATGAGGSQSAGSPATPVVAPAPVPPAVTGSLAAQPGGAGAVVTADGRATVVWQPGAVPAGATVSLAAADSAPAVPGTGVELGLSPAQDTLPWPVDIAYAAAPAGQVVGFSTDGKAWLPVAGLSSPLLSGSLLQGTYTDGAGVLHVLTRQAGRIAIFRAGRWGDPRRVSVRAPVLRKLTPLRATRLRDGTVALTARLSTSSQVHLYATVQPSRLILKRGSRLAVPLGSGTTRRAQALVLAAGGFPLQLRISGRGLAHRAVVRLQLSAVDPWGRRGASTLSFRVP